MPAPPVASRTAFESRVRTTPLRGVEDVGAKASVLTFGTALTAVPPVGVNPPGPPEPIGRGREQVDREVVLEEPAVRVARDRGEQGALDLLPGEVGGVDHPPVRMPTLAPEVERGGVAGLPRELHAELDQAADVARSLLDGESDDLLLAEPGADLQRVLDVALVGVALVVEHGRDPALRIAGARLGGVPLGDDRHPPMVRYMQRVVEAGDPAAEDQKVGFLDAAVHALILDRRFIGDPVREP